jgi:hypothetical protein
MERKFKKYHYLKKIPLNNGNMHVSKQYSYSGLSFNLINH